MYYVFGNDTRLTSKFIFYRDLPDDFESARWTSGERFKVAPTPMTLVAADEKPDTLSDFALVSGRLHVYSPKLRATLAKAGVTNIEYVPITLVDAKRGVTVSDYCVANIIGKVDCLDPAHSTVGTFSDGVGYSAVEEFTLIDARIQPVDGMSTPPQLFRLGEFRYHVIASASLKAAFERDGITGARFVATTDFC